MSARKLILAVVVTMLGVVGFGAARASAVQLTDETQPANGQTLTASPSDLILIFDEDLTTTPGVVLQSINNPNTPLCQTCVAERGDDARTWIVTLDSVLPPGTYRVVWQTPPTFRGEFTFSVGQTVPGTGQPTPTAAPGAVPAVDPNATTTVAAPVSTGSAGAPATKPASDDSAASALGVLARWLSALGISAVFGGLLLIALAWPEGVEYVITSKYLRAAWIMATVATVLVVITTRAVGMGEGIGSSISPTSWLDLRDVPGGAAVLLRLAFVAASFWVVFVPERIIDASTQIPGFAAPVLAVLTFGFSRTGEAGGGALGTGASILHAVSFAAWIGGVALLARVVVIGPGDEDLLHAVRGFGRIAGPALIGVVVSGALRSMQLSGGSHLLGTGYGRRLLLKIALFAVVVYVSLVNRRTVQERLARTTSLGGRAAARLRRAFSVELLAGVVVMLLGGWLVSGAAPGVAASARVDRTRAVVETKMQDNGIDVTVGATPAVVGTNTLLITVRKPVTGLVTMVVTLKPANDLAAGIEVEVASTLSGKGVMRVDGVPLGTGGVWNVSIAARDTDGPLAPVSGNFTITDPTAPAVDPAASTTAAPAIDPATGAPVTAAAAPGGAAVPTPAQTPNAATPTP